MSDETRQKLRDAETADAKLRAKVTDLKRECLAAVARGIPVRVDDVAKKVARAQPDVTRELGADGVKTLRGELAEGAMAIATEVDSAVEKIRWPRVQSEYSPIKSQDIHSALFEFLYGQRN